MNPADYTRIISNLVPLNLGEEKMENYRDRVLRCSLLSGSAPGAGQGSFGMLLVAAEHFAEYVRLIGPQLFIPDAVSALVLSLHI